jgi:hypothetical protein
LQNGAPPPPPEDNKNEPQQPTPKRPITPLSFASATPTRESYSGANPPEIIPSQNFSAVFVADNGEEQAKRGML